MAIAICAIFILPDFPHNTKWLTPEERALAISRLAEDGEVRAVHRKRTSMQGLWDAVSDWKVWWFTAAFIVQLTGQSFYIYFPTLSATMGYDTTVSLLLCAPPWVFCTIFAFALSRSVNPFYSDDRVSWTIDTLIRSKNVTGTMLPPMQSLLLGSLYQSLR